MHHMRNITEQLVELTNRLLDIPDFRFALDNECLLEIYF